MPRSDDEMLEAVYRRSATIRRRRRFVGTACVALVVVLGAVALPRVGEQATDVDTVDVPTTLTTPLPTAPAVLDVDEPGPAIDESAAAPARDANAPAGPPGAGAASPDATGAGTSGTSGGGTPSSGPGGRIVFVDGESSIVVVDADGSDARQLATFDTPWPAIARWSPDGSTVLFLDGGVRSQLTLIAADGSSRRQLETAAIAADGDWSPDGRWIAFVAAVPYATAGPSYGIFPTFSANHTADIALIASDGSSERPLTATTQTEMAPNWSPDGTRIAFARPAGLHSIAADGTDDRSVWPYSSSTGMAWSPDSARWAVSMANGGGSSNDGVLLMRPDGTQSTQLVRLAGAMQPSWSPDGTAVAFLRQPSDEASVLTIVPVAAPDALVEVPLIRGLGSGPPSWSPDGAYLTYCSDEGLHRVARDGSGGTLLVATPSCSVPDWSPA